MERISDIRRHTPRLHPAFGRLAATSAGRCFAHRRRGLPREGTAPSACDADSGAKSSIKSETLRCSLALRPFYGAYWHPSQNVRRL